MRIRVVPIPLIAVAVLAFGAVALAWVLQHQFGYAPCPWCTFQRLLYLLIGALALLAAGVHRRGTLAIALGASVPLLALGGVLAAWHQHTVAAQSDSCALTLADRVLGALNLPDLLPTMFEATARCDEANLPWLGVPFALWSLALFCILALLSLRAFRLRPHTLFLK